MISDERADVLTRATRRLREEQDAALAGASLGDMVPALGDPTWSRIVTDVRRARRQIGRISLDPLRDVLLKLRAIFLDARRAPPLIRELHQAVE